MRAPALFRDSAVDTEDGPNKNYIRRGQVLTRLGDPFATVTSQGIAVATEPLMPPQDTWSFGKNLYAFVVTTSQRHQSPAPPPPV